MGEKIHCDRKLVDFSKEVKSIEVWLEEHLRFTYHVSACLLKVQYASKFLLSCKCFGQNHQTCDALVVLSQVQESYVSLIII